ncbi:Na+/H+ antiporter NhaC family protein [Candidatus Avelusimicrobium alvi]|uniref:Na+/H+ antiporter NhaC family protein n=1 Tax=Candidatus Avelusimicrobium alvi TaxID=3416221 RepID=UPI003D0A1759
MKPEKIQPNPLALIPLAVFLISYLAVSLAAGDFYKMPITVAFVLSSVVAVWMSKGGGLHSRIELFCKGAANSNIMLMVMIFILAGAFAQTAKAMGAVDATVNLTLAILPGNVLAAGVFLAACVISVSVGTSVGTIVALTPVAAGLSAQTGISPALMSAVVVSGAMFGDNLSFISDTTIVATRTQGCKMSDKFKTNVSIVMPFAVLTTIIYVLIGSGAQSAFVTGDIPWIKVLPYFIVLAAAVMGVNVMVVLLGGTVLCGLIGLLTGAFDVWGWTTSMGAGINGMGELIIVTILAGGMLEMIRYNGGLAWIIQKMTARIRSRKGAELSIAGVVSFANLCTANNTIALIMAGPIAKEIAQRFHIAPNRSASLLDIFSCFVQGIIPYGAQLLMAASLSGVSPVGIMKYLYYPYLLGVGALLAIWLGFPRTHSQPAADGAMEA